MEKMTKSKIARARELRGGGVSDAEIARLLGVARKTVQRRLGARSNVPPDVPPDQSNVPLDANVNVPPVSVNVPLNVPLNVPPANVPPVRLSCSWAMGPAWLTQRIADAAARAGLLAPVPVPVVDDEPASWDSEPDREPLGWLRPKERTGTYTPSWAA